MRFYLRSVEWFANYCVYPLGEGLPWCRSLYGYLIEHVERSYWHMKRRKMSSKGSKSYFTATASKTHYKNVKPRPQRGGIRL
jgi:hypothetical protein